MTIILTFSNGTSTTANVAKTFTTDMINECFVGKDYKGFGVVTSAIKSAVTVY